MPSGMNWAGLVVLLLLAGFLAMVYAGAIIGIIENIGDIVPPWALLLVAGLLGIVVIVGGKRAAS
jgi:hypothetical protein